MNDNFTVRTSAPEELAAEEALDHIFKAVAESILDAPEAEILEDVRAAGENPERVAARVREILLAAARDFRA